MRRLSVLVVALGLVVVGCGLLPNEPTVVYGKAIKVGVPLGLTGNLSEESSMAKQGYDLWLDWVNGHQGGIEVQGVKHKVQLEYVDDQSKPAIDTQVANTLVTQDKVQFLLGPYGGSNSTAVAGVADSHHIPMVSANGSSTSVFSQGDYVFGVQTPAAQNLQALFDMAATLHPAPSTVAILSADDAFSVEVAKGTADYATSKGFKVILNKQYPAGTTNLYQLLTAVKDANPDIIVNSGHLVEAIAINKEAKDLRLNSKMFVYSVGPTMPEFATTLGRDANYVYTGSQWTAQAKYRPAYYMTSQQYVAAYQKRFRTDQEPNYQVADATAAGIALEKAIENANSLDSEKVRQALASLDLITFFGRIKFNSVFQDTYKPMLVEQIQGTHRQTVWPAESAGAVAQFPTPDWTIRSGVSPQAQAPNAKLPQTGQPVSAPAGGQAPHQPRTDPTDRSREAQ